MSSIPLSGAKQRNLQTMQQLANQVVTTSERIATGKKVNRAQDNPNAFFVTKGIENRNADLSNLLDSMVKGRDLIFAAQTGVDGIKKLIDQAEAILSLISQTASDEERATAAEEYNKVMSQISDLAKDSAYDGRNLLGGAGNTLTVFLNERSSAVLQVEPVDFINVASPVGLNLPDLTGADLATPQDVEAALGGLRDAKALAERTAAGFASQYKAVEDRQSFTRSLIDALSAYSVDLTAADTNEEGARLLALQTRQQLSTTSMSLANEADQMVLRLFG